MPSYNYKLTVDAIQNSSNNHEEMCEFMARKCRSGEDKYCIIGYFSCPVGGKCYRITKEDWMNVLVPSTETSKEQD